MVTELSINDVNDPDNCDLGLWIGRTATSHNSIELSISGLLHGCAESLSCTLSEDDAVKLAKALLKHIE